MSPIQFDGMTFGPAEIGTLRVTLSILRDAALDAGKFDYAVSLSHTIAILFHVAQAMREHEDANQN